MSSYPTVFVPRRSLRSGVAVAIGVGAGLWALPAMAHIALTSPPARYARDYQKNEPCGHAQNPPGEEPPTVFQAGETITVEFDEFVNHPGHYRIAIDPSGTDDFVSPTAFDDFYNSPGVLVDNVADEQNGGIHSIEVTLPDTPCDPCSLQLVQVMTGDGEWGPGNDDLYFQCADIVIEAVAGGSDGSTGGEGTTGAPGGDSTTGEADGSGTGRPGDDEPGDDEPGDDEPDDDDGGTTGVSTPSGDPGTGTGSTGTTAGSSSDDGGGCRVTGSGGDSSPPWWLLVVGLGGARRRRRGRA